MEEKFIITDRRSDGIEVISGFFWSITYHNMENFLNVQDLMERRRGIIAKYAKFFNISSHHPLEKVPTESAASAPANFIQTAVSAVILMTILVYLFINDLCAVVSVVVSILSICVGTLAYLHLWNVRLDAVSLISMLMSVGFSPISIIVGSDSNVKELSISSSSNISSGSDVGSIDTQTRLLVTLKGVGWPVVQSGLSTLLGMIPMTVVHAYVVAVFWKTVILVTVLGMLHALVLLPVIFLIFGDLKCCVNRLCCLK
ncbi:unnamed protein product [Gongylonema pulchrum]|uniref:SSD domain-containing protein n=1 Tax=Gongylonema pulchrum TaxID=637853 RepID=A0A183CZV7_9BILA|nr:unnamed protein product [Gongylonema pulchrum]